MLVCSQVSLQRRSTACALALIVAFASPMFLASTAYGQLRTGRCQRSLYQNTSRGQSDAGQKRQRQPEVVTVSHAQYVQEPSVLEGEVGEVLTEGVPAEIHMGAVPSVGCDSCGDAGMAMGSCGTPGCSCGGDMAVLAPTAAGYCGSPLGTLQSIWCRLSVRAEVPLYWRRAAAPPALVTTSTAGTSSDLAGELGQATTSVLLGDGKLNEDSQAGFRLTLSTYLGHSKRFGVMFRYWNAGDQDDTFNFNSNDFPILARPIFNTTVAGNFENDAQLIAFPGENTGNLQVQSVSEVQGVDLTLQRLLYQDRFTRVDWLYGYKHVSIDERLSVMSNTDVISGTLQGASISVMDNFETDNRFHGVSYGIMSTRRTGCWQMETMFRLGFGNLERTVRINGTTTTQSGGLTSTSNQGLLARNTNSRPFVDETFIIIPEVGINFAYLITPGMHFSVGYNYLMLPNVAQASQQINDDLAVNLSDPLTGTLDPSLQFDERQYWLHSLGFGLQLRY